MVDVQVRLEEHGSACSEDAIADVEILARVERAAGAEHVVEPAHPLPRRSPEAAVRAHAKDPESVSRVQALTVRYREHGRHPVKRLSTRQLWRRQHLAPDELDVRLAHGANHRLEPSRGHDTVVVGEGHEFSGRVFHRAVPCARDADLLELYVAHVAVPAGDVADDVGRRRCAALVDDQDLERRILLGQYALDRGADVMRALPRADGHGDRWVLLGRDDPVHDFGRPFQASAWAATDPGAEPCGEASRDLEIGGGEDSQHQR